MIVLLGIIIVILLWSINENLKRSNRPPDNKNNGRGRY